MDTSFSIPVAVLGFALVNISNDILSGMETDQIQTLLLDTRDNLLSIINTPSILIQTTNLFSIPPLLTSVARTMSPLTPNMNRAHSAVPSPPG